MQLIVDNMEKEFVYHLFMSQLKKANCDHITKESTSLLMKELDQATKGDGEVGSPKSPENVARAFLQSVKGRNSVIKKPSPSRKLVPCKVPDVIDARVSSISVMGQRFSNGHTSVIRENTTSSTFLKSPLLSRCRRKLRLDLKHQQSNSSEQHRHQNSRTPEPGSNLQNESAFQLEEGQPISVAIASCSTTPHPDDKDEHLLIAFNSALLHVKPNLPSAPMDSNVVCSKSTASPVNSVQSENPRRQEMGTSTDPSPDTTTLASTPATESFHRLHNRLCTSYRVKVNEMKNPVDACLLPNDYLAIADYDNGLLILNSVGELVEHRRSARELNACGVASTQRQYKLLLLVFRDGLWIINVYDNFELVDTISCPQDADIENWALRRIVVVPENLLYLMASGERKSCIWRLDLNSREWKLSVTEGPKFGIFNDMSVRYRNETGETRFLLCDWRKAKLWTLTMNEKFEQTDNRSTKMKRVKGQEWIVQGPTLAALDEQFDILIYDGSGKIFLFDGETYKYKKIVADVGRGEVSSVIVRDGWLYALCRYRLSIEAYMYKEYAETHV